MLSNHMFQRIRTLHAQGKKPAEIARLLGIDPKTVGKYLADNTPPRYPVNRKGRTRVDPLASELGEKLRHWLAVTPGFSALELFDLLVLEGYRGSERTVDRRVAQIRGEKPKERFFEQEYRPGEQSQFDFKECVELPFIDGPRVVHLHVGTLPYSGTCRIRGYPFRNFECFIDGNHSFFEEVGGLTLAIRIDNLSAAVAEILRGSKRKYTQAFARATAYYDWTVLPCTPGKGNEKGDVERDIRTYAKRIKNAVSHEGVIFRSWEHLNSWLHQLMLAIAPEASRQRLLEEQTHLKPLPPRDAEVLCRVQTGPSSPYGTIRVDKSAYSVPDPMIGVSCRTIVGPYDVKIHRSGDRSTECVVIHPRKADGEHSILLEHVLPSLVRKPHAMVRWAHQGILFPEPVFKRFYTSLRRSDPDGAEREFLRVINLVQFTPLPEIAAAMELVLEASPRVGFEEVRELLLGSRRPGNVLDISSRLNQRPLKPELSVYDSLIPKKGSPPP